MVRAEGTRCATEGVGASLALLDAPARSGAAVTRAAYVSRAVGARFLVSLAGRVRALPGGPAPSAASATHLYAVRGASSCSSTPTLE